jgi:ribokinase
MGVPHVVVTLGDEGSLLLDRSHPVRRVKPFPVVAVDTVGAGDAYNGVLAVALAERAPVLDAMRRASAAAALTVTQPGAQSALPDRAAIDRLLNEARTDLSP